MWRTFIESIGDFFLGTVVTALYVSIRVLGIIKPFLVVMTILTLVYMQLGDLVDTLFYSGVTTLALFNIIGGEPPLPIRGFLHGLRPRYFNPWFDRTRHHVFLRVYHFEWHPDHVLVPNYCRKNVPIPKLPKPRRGVYEHTVLWFYEDYNRYYGFNPDPD